MAFDASVLCTFSNLHKLFEFLRSLLQIQLLLSGLFIYGRNQTQNV